MTTATAVPLRIKASYQGNDFDGEGREEVVKEQYAAWLALVANSPPATKDHNGRKPDPHNKVQKDKEPLDELWNRAYKRDENHLSLNVIPQTEEFNADAILLLLYGYQTLNKLDAVDSGEIMNAARQSGLRIDRLDRWLNRGYMQYVIKGGNGRGSRYSLNNRGLTRAQELLETMFE